jgi:hypothetical protein
MAQPRRHLVLVEIDWDTGTEGYSFDSCRTHNRDYKDLVQSISPITRSVSVFGSITFPTSSVVLYNRDLYFSIKLYTAEHRNRKIRIRVLPPDTNISEVITVFEGVIVRAKINNGLLQIDAVGHNFNEVFNSPLSNFLPVLGPGRFPNAPVGQVPTLLPLVYGGVTPSLETGLSTISFNNGDMMRGFLFDTMGIEDFSWQGVTPVVSSHGWGDVCWSEELGIFVAMGASVTDDRVMTSPDGLNWTIGTDVANPIDENWDRVIWVKELGLFVAVSNNAVSGNGVTTSPDGIGWAARAASSLRNWRGLAWSPKLGLIAAVGYNGIQTSSNGISWTGITPPVANQFLQSICWSDELEMFVAVGGNSGDSNTSCVLTSVDGIAWTPRNIPIAADLLDVCWSPERRVFVAVGYAVEVRDRIVVSEDGVTWLLSTCDMDLTLTRIKWSSELGLFAAVASNHTGNDVITSPDAVTWTRQLSPALSSWGALAWSPTNNRFVAVGSALPGSTSNIMYSRNDLDDTYRYAIAARPVVGDASDLFFNFSDPGRLNLVLRYGVQVPLSVGREIRLYTDGTDQIPYIGFAYDQRSTSEASQDRPEITFYSSGVPDGPDTLTDPVIRNPVRAKEHFLEGYTALPLEDMTVAKTLATEQHYAESLCTAGAPAVLSAVIQDLDMTVQDVIEAFDRSFAMITYPTRAGKLGTIVSPIGPVGSSVLSLTDESEILKDSFDQDMLEDVATNLVTSYSYRWISGQSGDPKPGQQFLRQLNYEIPGALARLFPAGNSFGIARELKLPYCRRVGSVINILRAYSEYLRPGAQSISLSLPIQFFNQMEIGDYVDITHWQGVSATGGFAAEIVRVLGVTVNVNAMTPTVTINAFKRAPGIVVHDNFDRSPSASLGLSWSESEGSSGVLSLVAVPDSRQSQTNCLLVNTGGFTGGLATWNVTTEDDQVASIQVISVDTSVSSTFGAFVRGSGTRTSFTGYAAVIESTGDGSSQTSCRIVLRKYSAENMTSSSGTEVGSADLTGIHNPFAAVVLEVRAVGSRIEVCYWDDLGRNNLGKCITFDDNAPITSGKFGVFVDTAISVYLTNFYGRGLV